MLVQQESISPRILEVPDSSEKRQNKNYPHQRTLSIRWTNTINKIRNFVNIQIQWIAKKAATNPKTCVAICVTASILMVVIGLLTNFNMDGIDEESWLPIGSRTSNHRRWILEESGFLSKQRNILFNIHGNGANIVGMEGAKRAFEVVNAVRSLPRYEEFCAPSLDVDEDLFADGCPLLGVTQFWENNITLFEDQIHKNVEANNAMSAEQFPDGRYVYAPSILGNVGMLYGTVVFVQSYPLYMIFPELPGIEDFELEVIDITFAIQKNWEEEEDSIYNVEVFSSRSMLDELNRGVVNDIPLVPLCFVFMSLFTCLLFSKRNPVESRSILGIGAVICVFLAIMLAYGIMFCIGVSLSSMTQLLPFIMFGVGLDDAFIIIGAYSRTEPRKDPIQRIDETMADIGSSIFLTTITSVMAFAFGAVSSVPIVRGLCHYAYATLIVNFILQITLFVALIVLDERRIQSNRRDCCACCISRTGPNSSDKDETNEQHAVGTSNKVNQITTSKGQAHFADRIMTWYAKQLLCPCAQVTVLVLFGAAFVSMCYSVSQLKQEFDFTEVLPVGSYITDYFIASSDFSQQSSPYPAVYFRCVDQSNEDIQRQMEEYVDELVALEEVGKQPPFFWLRDLKKVIDHGDLHHLTFNEQLDIFLDIPIFKQLYKRDIVRDEWTGDIIASRTVVDMKNVDQLVIDDMINGLNNQRAVSIKQPINNPEGLSHRTMNDPICEESENWAFFMFEEQFPTWEFYAIAVDELLFSTVVGIVAVTIVGILLIPHWTVVLFIFPMITISYIDLLGLLQFLGAKINAMTYVSMVMSIGLMVDFIMHVLHRYYECKGNTTRRQKVTETLGTMGASVFLGGISSFLGVLPLAGSTTTMIQTIFINFISLVIVGVTHGLILLPVVLSVMGPTDTHNSSDDQQDGNVRGSDTDIESRFQTETMDTLTTDGSSSDSDVEGDLK